MNDEVYKLRRQIIELIYEAKRGGVKLPRISVRVGEQTARHKNILGCAMMNKNLMWITKDAIDLGIDTLRNVVFHEIAHAVFNVDHDEKCPLMAKELPDTMLNKEDCLKHLLKYQTNKTLDQVISGIKYNGF